MFSRRGFLGRSLAATLAFLGLGKAPDRPLPEGVRWVTWRDELKLDEDSKALRTRQGRFGFEATVPEAERLRRGTSLALHFMGAVPAGFRRSAWVVNADPYMPPAVLWTWECRDVEV